MVITLTTDKDLLDFYHIPKSMAGTTIEVKKIHIIDIESKEEILCYEDIYSKLILPLDLIITTESNQSIYGQSRETTHTNPKEKNS